MNLWALAMGSSYGCAVTRHLRISGPITASAEKGRRTLAVEGGAIPTANVKAHAPILTRARWAGRLLLLTLFACHSRRQHQWTIRTERRTKINQSINQSIDQSINQSINQSIHQSINHIFDQSINQSIISSIHQSINQSITPSSSMSKTDTEWSKDC